MHNLIGTLVHLLNHADIQSDNQVTAAQYLVMQIQVNSFSFSSHQTSKWQNVCSQGLLP